MVGRAGGGIIRGRRLFLIFPLKGGDYLREGYYLRNLGTLISVKCNKELWYLSPD